MKTKELAMKELRGFLPGLLALISIRLLKLNNSYYPATYVVMGVPPWRKLRSKDMWDKYSFEIEPRR